MLPTDGIINAVLFCEQKHEQFEYSVSASMVKLWEDDRYSPRRCVNSTIQASGYKYDACATDTKVVILMRQK